MAKAAESRAVGVGAKATKTSKAKANFNANVQHFVPAPNMYNPQMYYPPQQQYPPQQGGVNYQPGNNSHRGGKRSGRGGRNAYHNNRNQQVQYPNGMNAQQVAAYQQQQMAYFHWQQQQHMMYAAQHNNRCNKVNRGQVSTRTSALLSPNTSFLLLSTSRTPRPGHRQTIAIGTSPPIAIAPQKRR